MASRLGLYEHVVSPGCWYTEIRGKRSIDSKVSVPTTESMSLRTRPLAGYIVPSAAYVMVNGIDSILSVNTSLR